MNKDNDLYKCVQHTFLNIKGDVADRPQGDSKGVPPNSLPTNNTPLMILYTGLK